MAIGWCVRLCEVCHDMAVSVSSLAGCVQLQCNYSLLATEESSQCPQLRPDQGHLSLVINLSSSLKYLDTYLLSTFHRWPLTICDTYVILKIDVDSCWYGSQLMIFKNWSWFYFLYMLLDMTMIGVITADAAHPLPLLWITLIHWSMSPWPSSEPVSVTLCHYTDLLSCLSCVWVWLHKLVLMVLTSIILLKS